MRRPVAHRFVGDRPPSVARCPGSFSTPSSRIRQATSSSGVSSWRTCAAGWSSWSWRAASLSCA
eukprot:2830639-Alexandrium_andersonii.AAC.1